MTRKIIFDEVGIQFQSTSLLSLLTVRETLETYRNLYQNKTAIELKTNDVNSCLTTLMKHQVDLSDLTIRSPNLETVFLNLTGRHNCEINDELQTFLDGAQSQKSRVFPGRGCVRLEFSVSVFNCSGIRCYF